MNNIFIHLNLFLLITSLQILALGTIALCLAKTFKIRGSSALWMFRLVLLLPFLSPAGWMIAIPKNLSISHYIQSLPISVGAGPCACPDPRACPIIAPTILSRQTYGVLSNTPYVESIDPLQKRQATTQSQDLIPSFQSNQTYGLYSYTPSLENNDPPSRYESPLPETTIPSQSSPIDFMNPILSILWFFGICIYLIHVFRGIVIQAQIVRSSEPVHPGDLHLTFIHCAGLLGLKRLPRLMVSPSPCIPFLSLFGAQSSGAWTSCLQIFSSLSQTIILPAHLLEPQNRDGLCYTILHELAHYKRNDSWWLLGETLLGVLYFFHPLVSLLRKRIERERESLCDRDVINATEQPAQYAEFLLNQVWQSSRRIQSACAIPILGQSSAIGKRVKEILANTRITRFIRLRNALVLSGLLILTVPLLALKTSTDTQGQPQTSENQSLEYNLTDHDYLQWIEWIRKNIDLHENGVEYKTVKAKSERAMLNYLQLQKLISLDPPDDSQDLDEASDKTHFYYPSMDGVVKDFDTGKEIPDAEIMGLRPADRSERPPNFLVERNLNPNSNHFFLNPQKPTFYALVVTKDGYSPYFFSFEVKSNPTLNYEGKPELSNFPSIPEILLKKANCSIRAKVRYNGFPVKTEYVNFGVFRNQIFYNPPFETISQEESTYRITGIEPGDMKISCRYNTETESYRCYPKPVHISEGECVDVTFDITPRIRYEITLQPADSGRIGLFKIDVPNLPEADRALLCVNRSDNQFTMELPEGHQTVRIKVPGYKRIEFDPLALSQKVTIDRDYRSRRGAFTLTLEPDPYHESPDIDGVLTGKITNNSIEDLTEYYMARARFLHREGKKSIFHIVPRMQSIEKIEIDTKLPDGKLRKDRILTDEQDWSYDPENHRLSLTVPIDPVNQQVTVCGVRAIPWQWKTQGPIEPGSVKVFMAVEMNYDRYVKYLKEHGKPMPSFTAVSGGIVDTTNMSFTEAMIGEPGIDYNVNEKEGRIELRSRIPGRIMGSYPEINHWISYRDYRDPTQPTKTFEGRIGYNQNIRLMKEITEPPKKVIQIPIESTYDPAIYTSPYFLKKETLRVSIVSRSDYKLVKKLIQGEGYDYDPERSLVQILKPNLLDRSKELLLVYAEPRYGDFIFHRLQISDPISVSINNILLQKDKDYTIDYQTGTVRLADPAQIKPGTPFRIDAGSQTLLSQTQ